MSSKRSVATVEGFGKVLPDDPIAAPKGRLQLRVGESTTGLTLKVPAGVEPGRCTRVDLEITAFEQATHDDTLRPDCPRTPGW
jgi:hypothetical protein